MSFRYKSRERDRDDRKDRGGFGAPRERDREWENRDNWERGDRDYRERERFRERDSSRDRDYDRSRDRGRGDREKSRDKERDRSYDDRDRDRYRERDKGSSSGRYKRNHGYNNVDEDNNLSYENNAKDGYGSDRNSIQKWDWSCYKCGVNNFKRREQCFKCGTPREESAAAIEVGDEISLNPTNCLILRDLASHTTEEKILTALEQVTALPIKSIRIPRDPISGSTRCICFVELHTTLEASQLFNLLCSSTSGFIVDGYPLNVCYAKRNVSSNIIPRVSNVASVALAAAQWTNQSEQQPVNTMITGESNFHESTISNSSSKSFGANQHVKTTQAKIDSIEQNPFSLGTVSVNGVLYPKYPPPDTSTYQYEEKSGYYYDAATGLYYDANSHYYYNPTTQSYLFWDGKHSTYLPVDNKVSSSSTSSTAHGQPNDQTPIEANGKNREILNDNQDKSKETQDSKFGKQDKVTIAKKIAKDMEKWAKTLNQKKESSKFLNQPTSIAFNCEETEIPVPTSTHSQSMINSCKTNDYVSHEEHTKKRRIEYDQTIDSPEHRNEDKVPEKPESEDSSSRSPNQTDSSTMIQAQEYKLIDLERLLCLLCKRQFNSKEQLLKHQQASDLHKNNLIKLGESRSLENQHGEPGSSSGDSAYRDRAKERRKKYGQPNIPEIVPEISSIVEPSSPPFVEPKTVTGIGSKMLKAMGWSEGEGLGRSKEKATSIIEVERRASGVGIGMKTTTTGVGESYKDAVKRASWLRFQELSKKE
ncbi:RNA-binding protein 5-B-like [Panonychus citri]|uniref:RNA-binding protein 5-B-like n=1 Tax=Panonychus citri TaxID=50023 RepID=UPI0023075463|nr:RNA-binding protein 5-B-like [Panonychus citri]